MESGLLNLARLGTEDSGIYNLLNGMEYNFEKEMGKFGVTFGKELLFRAFPDAYQVKGQSVYRIPHLCKVVVTCRKIIRVK